MANYGYVLFYSLVGGVFSLIGGVLLLSHKKVASTLGKYATPFAGGGLLAAVFLDLLKDGLEQSSADTVLLATLIGIITFFLAEGFLSWFHHHHNRGDETSDSTVPLIIVGDTIHNAMDGVAIAAAFLISVPTGIVTTLAIAAHEIPHEIGDFGLLLSRGLSRRKVLLVNVVSALATTLAALITFALGSANKIPVGVLLGLSAGFLLYIATSDIIPTIHQHRDKYGHNPFDLQALLLILGAVTVGVSIQLAHHFIP
jgi:zinc and cadmium transporter